MSLTFTFETISVKGVLAVQTGSKAATKTVEKQPRHPRSCRLQDQHVIMYNLQSLGLAHFLGWYYYRHA